ncbi:MULTISPECIES: hypothetical protein [unclassified Sphingopyxis]|jgi:hypothetical protein|uniref:hypothetical protein n=1 Tax=unclassified Sphingopyxis TaxID=2614943 RepID=UPI0025CE20C7|nr:MULTISPECIES: hypothetical protein [unclassified Sphingopyxis]
MMSRIAIHPQGESGPAGARPNGPTWFVIPLPQHKAEREQLIASRFVKAVDRWVARESEPTLAPFDQPKQTEENDLAFIVETSAGKCRWSWQSSRRFPICGRDLRMSDGRSIRGRRLNTPKL